VVFIHNWSLVTGVMAASAYTYNVNEDPVLVNMK